MKDFDFTDELRAILSRKEVEAWLLDETRGGAAPTVNDAGSLVFRFEGDAEAARFEAQWLGTRPGAAG